MSLSDKVIELTREDDYICLYEEKHVKQALKELMEELEKGAYSLLINKVKQIFGEELLK